MTEVTAYFEYGYRLANGDEWWEVYDPDEVSYIPHNGIEGIPYIDLYSGNQVYAIRIALEDAEEEGVVLRRKVTVTRDEPEVVV